MLFFVEINTNMTNKRVVDQLAKNGRYLVKSFKNENRSGYLKILKINQLKKFLKHGILLIIKHMI